LSVETCTLSLEKNDTDVAHYNFDADQPMARREIIFALGLLSGKPVSR